MGFHSVSESFGLYAQEETRGFTPQYPNRGHARQRGVRWTTVVSVTTLFSPWGPHRPRVFVLYPQQQHQRWITRHFRHNILNLVNFVESWFVLSACVNVLQLFRDTLWQVSPSIVNIVDSQAMPSYVQFLSNNCCILSDYCWWVIDRVTIILFRTWKMLAAFLSGY